MDELTDTERRLVLVALWRFRDQLGHDFDLAGGNELVFEADSMDRLDAAALKLGGDPAKHFYGAPELPTC